MEDPTARPWGVDHPRHHRAAHPVAQRARTFESQHRRAGVLGRGRRTVFGMPAQPNRDRPATVQELDNVRAVVLPCHAMVRNSIASCWRVGPLVRGGRPRSSSHCLVASAVSAAVRVVSPADRARRPGRLETIASLGSSIIMGGARSRPPRALRSRLRPGAQTLLRRDLGQQRRGRRERADAIEAADGTSLRAP